MDYPFYCFKCSYHDQTVDHLISHLKNDHLLKGSATYYCKQSMCFRVFSNIRTFQRHLNSHLPVPELVDESTYVQVVSEQRVSDFQIKNIIPPSIQLEPYSVLNRESINIIKSNLDTDIASLILDMYSNSLVPRNFVNFVVTSLKNILTNIIGILQKVLSSKDFNLDLIKELLDIYISCFNAFDTEYKSVQHFIKNKTFIEPVSYVVGYRKIETKTADLVKIDTVPITAKMIPLRYMFQSLFSNTNLLHVMKEYLNKLNSEQNVISNFVQGELWRDKIKNFKNKTVFPIFIFFDDYETGNPLGSHAGKNKLGAIYVTLPSMPPYLTSKLSNIFLFALFYSEDRKEFGNQAILSKLIEELDFLQEHGIEINTYNPSEKVYFKLGLINGDNLGLNSILGFTESFSANYCCRFCSISKRDLRKDVLEKPNLLRNKHTYDIELDLHSTLTGIKENSVWNTLSGFHVTSNFSADIMHDLFEGVCVYDITGILYELIFSYKLFSVETLNSRIQGFPYCEQEKSNKPPIITAEKLKSKLKMSASEMLCLCKYLGLIIGDLVPHELPLWNLWVKLREIIDFVTSSDLHVKAHNRIQVLVEEHNLIYQTFFGHLKPKFHFLTHYHLITRKSGPLTYLWSMRAEQKHRESKMSSNVSCNFRNKIHTLALKSQLKFCKSINNYKSEDHVKYSCKGTQLTDSDFETYFNNFDRLYVKEIKWLDYKGTLYKHSSVLILDILEDKLPLFGKIKKIFLYKEKIPYILCELWESVSFNYHYFAYEVCTKTNHISEIYPLDNMLFYKPRQSYPFNRTITLVSKDGE